MARSSFIFCKEQGRFVPKGAILRQRAIAASEKRADFPCPRIVTDGMDGIKSMVDGRVYESKSAYYKSVERAGCAIVGNDKNWHDYVAPVYDERAHEADIVTDIKRAIEEESSK